MNTLQESYQTVAEHIAADIDKTDKMPQKCYDWLVCRCDTLNENRDHDISRFKSRMEAYLSQCEKFWKERQGRTYEKKINELLEIRKRVAKIYSLTGFDACYALQLALKPLRTVLPLPQYSEYAPALAALEAIKSDCHQQLVTYINAD